MAVKKSKFKGGFKKKVATNTTSQKNKAAGFSYLSLPKGVSMYKEPAGGMEILDILPYIVTNPAHEDKDVKAQIAVKNSAWYRSTFKRHTQIGEANLQVVCPTSFGKKCPICEYRKLRQEEGAEQDELDNLKAKKRSLYSVVPLGNKEYEEKPHIWDISDALFQNQLNTEIEFDEDNGVFPDPEEGLSLKIRFTKETYGKFTYADTDRIDFVARKHNGYDDSFLETAPQLDDLYIVKSYDELKALFFEEDTSDIEEIEEIEEETPKPARARKTATPPRSRKPEPVVEEEPEEDPEPVYTVEAIELGEEYYCVACQGTGFNTRGAECRSCKGTGVNRAEWEKDQEEQMFNEPEEEEVVPPKPARTRRAAPKPPAPKAGECPFGHTFGTDCEEHSDCDTCDLWDKCIEEK